MAVQNLPIIVPSAPEGFCPNTWQELLNFIGQSYAQLASGNVQVLSQSNQPNADQRTGFIWHDPDTGLIYKYIGGAWIAPNLVAPGSSERRLWEDTEANLITYDGGSAGAVGDSSGPMWEADHNYDGRMPMGPGLLPSSDPAKTLTVSENYGTATYTPTDTEFGGFLAHVHCSGRFIDAFPGRDYVYPSIGSLAGDALTGIGVSGNYVPPPKVGLNTLAGEWCNTGAPGLASNAAISTIKLNIVNPVRGCFVIKRTARKNYVGS